MANGKISARHSSEGGHMQQFPEASAPTQVSGQRLFIGRLLETFFRHRWLYVLPLVPFLALGVATVTGRGPSYRSSGVILINKDTLINQLTTNQSGNNPFGEILLCHGEWIVIGDLFPILSNLLRKCRDRGHCRILIGKQLIL